jgi:hypothetical protein
MSSCLAGCDSLTICCWERCYAPTKKSLDAIASPLKTGDLFIACASPTGRAAGQYAISSSPWDHSGIIWKHDDGELYVIDSGSSRYYKSICRRPLHFGDGAAPADSAWSADGNGPQMYSLRALIEEQGKRPLEVKAGKTPWYYSRLGVRPLAKPLSGGELQKLRASIESMCDRPYQKDAGEMTSAAVDLCDCCGLTANKGETRDSLFCSELVAALYKDTGLLPAQPPASEYVPSDFSAYHGCNLSALCGCCWLTYALGACGVGDMRRAANSEGGAGKLFAGAIVLKTLHPPVGSCARAPQSKAVA